MAAVDSSSDSHLYRTARTLDSYRDASKTRHLTSPLATSQSQPREHHQRTRASSRARQATGAQASRMAWPSCAASTTPSCMRSSRKRRIRSISLHPHLLPHSAPLLTYCGVNAHTQTLPRALCAPTLRASGGAPTTPKSGWPFARNTPTRLQLPSAGSSRLKCRRTSRRRRIKWTMRARRRSRATAIQALPLRVPPA